MKLLIPVGAITLGAGVCCCGDIPEFVKGMQSGMEEGIAAQQGTDAPPVLSGEGGTAVVSGAPPSSTAVSGSCGRFKDWGLTGPEGATVTICTTGDGNDTLIMNSTISPADSCKSIKTWADGAGFTLQTESTFGGTSALIMEKGGDQLTVGCMEVMGKNTVSLTLSAK